MTEVFVIRNQHGHYRGKGSAWVDGHEPRAVLRLRHRDEAVNTLVELSTRDVSLRGEIVAAGVDGKGLPIIEPSAVPLPSEGDAGANSPPDGGAGELAADA
jgi:hypothetical protein